MKRAGSGVYLLAAKERQALIARRISIVTNNKYVACLCLYDINFSMAQNHEKRRRRRRLLAGWRAPRAAPSISSKQHILCEEKKKGRRGREGREGSITQPLCANKRFSPPSRQTTLYSASPKRAHRRRTRAAAPAFVATGVFYGASYVVGYISTEHHRIYDVTRRTRSRAAGP